MQKTVVMVHGWEGYPEEGWRPWLKDELIKRGWKVVIPAMPNTKHPKPEEWFPYLQKIVEKENDNIYLLGHSLGCPTILKVLENKKASGVILVAGFTKPIPDSKEIDPFVDKPFDFKRIKQNCPKFIAIHSDNDPWVPISSGIFFENVLGAELIIVHGAKHFSGDDGLAKLPIVLESLIRISKPSS